MFCSSRTKVEMMCFSRMIEAAASNRASCQARSGTRDSIAGVSLKDSQTLLSEWLGRFGQAALESWRVSIQGPKP